MNITFLIWKKKPACTDAPPHALTHTDTSNSICLFATSWPWHKKVYMTTHPTTITIDVKNVKIQNSLIWLAIRKKGLSDICVKCRLGLACTIRAG